MVSAVLGSLAAENGHTAIVSSKSLRCSVPHTTTVCESDAGENNQAVRGVPRRHMLGELHQLQNGRQDADGKCCLKTQNTR